MKLLTPFFIFFFILASNSYGQAKNIESDINNKQEQNLIYAPNVRGGNFPIPPDVRFPTATTYIQGKTAPANLQNPQEFIVFQSVFPKNTLENITKGKHFQTIVSPLHPTFPSSSIKIVCSTPQKYKKYFPVAHLTVRAKGEKEDMFSVVAKAALEAMKKGADILVIYRWGGEKFIKSHGIGGFLGQNSVYFSETRDIGGASVGGLGAGGVKGAYYYKPWINAYGLKSKSKHKSSIPQSTQQSRQQPQSKNIEFLKKWKEE